VALSLYEQHLLDEMETRLLAGRPRRVVRQRAAAALTVATAALMALAATLVVSGPPAVGFVGLALFLAAVPMAAAAQRRWRLVRLAG